MPTNEEVKFKAKAWIDVFGARFAKAVGSLFTSAAHGNLEVLRERSFAMIVVLSLALMAVAYHLGSEFESLVFTGRVIGDEGTLDTPTPPFPPGAGHGRNSSQGAMELVERGGLRPGDVGYDGYDLGLFEGVFEDAPSPSPADAAVDTVAAAAVIAADGDGASLVQGRKDTPGRKLKPQKPRSRYL